MTRRPTDRTHGNVRRLDEGALTLLVEDLWECRGWQTRSGSGVDTAVTGSDGAPVHAEHPERGARRLLQCHALDDGQLVSATTVVTAAEDAAHAGADGATVVTTTGFTDDAAHAASEHGVDLVDGDELARLAADHDLTDLLATYAPATTLGWLRRLVPWVTRLV